MISTQVAAAQATDQIEDRCLRLRARADSQDAWIFRAPVPPLAAFGGGAVPLAKRTRWTWRGRSAKAGFATS